MSALTFLHIAFWVPMVAIQDFIVHNYKLLLFHLFDLLLALASHFLCSIFVDCVESHTRPFLIEKINQFCEFVLMKIAAIGESSQATPNPTNEGPTEQPVLVDQTTNATDTGTTEQTIRLEDIPDSPDTPDLSSNLTTLHTANVPDVSETSDTAEELVLVKHETQVVRRTNRTMPPRRRGSLAAELKPEMHDWIKVAGESGSGSESDADGGAANKE